jgi:hypothetical protein
LFVNYFKNFFDFSLRRHLLHREIDCRRLLYDKRKGDVHNEIDPADNYHEKRSSSNPSRTHLRCGSRGNHGRCNHFGGWDCQIGNHSRVLTIPRSSIQSIGYATPDENQQLEEKWTAEEERLEQERAKKRDEEAKVEAAQKGKGLVIVERKRISQTEIEQMEEEEIRKQTEERKAVNEPGETAEKTGGPTAATSPKIIIDLPDEVKEIIDVQFKTLESVRKNLTPIERWEAHFFAESYKKLSEARKKLSDTDMGDARIFGDDTPLSEDTPIFTVTNKTDMCVDVDFHIEIYNDSGEMTEDTLQPIIYSRQLEPHQSRPSPFWLTNDMKEVRISLDSIETYDFIKGFDWDTTKNFGCTRNGKNEYFAR